MITHTCPCGRNTQGVLSYSTQGSVRLCCAATTLLDLCSVMHHKCAALYFLRKQTQCISAPCWLLPKASMVKLYASLDFKARGEWGRRRISHGLASCVLFFQINQCKLSRSYIRNLKTRFMYIFLMFRKSKNIRAKQMGFLNISVLLQIGLQIMMVIFLSVSNHVSLLNNCTSLHSSTPYRQTETVRSWWLRIM